jgi:Zn-dependent protease
LQYLFSILFVIPALLIAITVHEYSHGLIADALGDPTPRLSGRLSLNPLHHLDFLGSLMILLVHVGWAKPVPVNPRYFKDPKRDMMLVGIAGPIANFVTAFVFGLPLRLGLFWGGTYLYDIFHFIVAINVGLGIFNLMPLPPLDGSRILQAFLPAEAQPAYRWLEQYGVLILILVVFVFPGFFTFFFRPILNFFMNLFLPGSGWV